MAAPPPIGRRSGGGGVRTRRTKQWHGGGDSGDGVASRHAKLGEEVEGATADQTVSVDPSGEGWCGGGVHRRRRGGGPSREREREGGGSAEFLRKSPPIFRNLHLGPSSSVAVDCGFDFRFLERLFCKTVTNASRGSSDGRRTARIAWGLLYCRCTVRTVPRTVRERGEGEKSSCFNIVSRFNGIGVFHLK